MRSQFKPAAPASSEGNLSAPALYAQTGKIQTWLAGLALLVVAAILSVTVLGVTAANLFQTLPADGTELNFDPLTIKVVLTVGLGLLLGYGLIVLTLMWRVWQCVKTLTTHATTTNGAAKFLPAAKRLLIWVRFIQVGPFVLFILGFIFSLIEKLTQRAGLGEVAAVLGFSPDAPGESVRTALSLLLTFFILESIRVWLKAVSAHARGSKNLISPKLGPMGAWTLVWYLGLGLTTLGALAGTFIFFLYPLDKLPFKDTTAIQAGMFSRIAGGFQGSMLLFLLINVTLIVLLSLLRGYATQVTTALDERSLHARRQGQVERMQQGHQINPDW